jgi:DNA-binding NtrC family response regulator
MSISTRILFFGDLPSDTELAKDELRNGGIRFTSQRVNTRTSLIVALNKFCPDIVISGYAMPEFDGMQALKITLQHDQNISVIILSGSVREHIAVECMKAGANVNKLT